MRGRINIRTIGGRRVLLVVTLAALATAGPASAKSYSLSRAAITYRVRPDGSVQTAERLTFAFDGSFSGAYRLIPSVPPQSISRVSVSEPGTVYEPGGSAEVGSSSPPGTFGTTVAGNGDWTQVAWHYAAQDTSRTFTVSYVMRKYVTAYADVGDLYLQAWGDQWPVALRQLHVEVVLPGRVAARERRLFRVWGHPASVHGHVRIAAPDRVVLDATNVPEHRFVELRTTFPRRLLTSTAGAQALPVNGLPQIAARERHEYASPYGTAPDPVGSTGGGGGGQSFFSRYWFYGLFALFASFGLTRRVRRTPDQPWYTPGGWYWAPSSGSGGDSGSSGGGGDLGGGGGDGGGGGGGGAW
jgi:uncharacterized membrane protein YgcG